MERLGRYEILGELGRGAMGVVYRAQDPVIGRTVAIKTIRLGDITDPEELQRLKQRLFREARSAGILSHPHIVTIYDIGQEGDTAYIAMEFVTGSTLEQIMRSQGVLEREVILAVLMETASALDYAHQKGIVHRDVKPANIMINENGAAKITDFGVAKILSQQITQADTVLGTPSYMSPEQIEARGVDGRSDQFALAVITYQLLTGEKPFAGDTLPSLLFKIVREDAPPSFHLNATLAPEVDAVLRKAMSKASAARYETCTGFVQALMTGLEASPGWQPLRRGSISSMPTVMPAVNTDESATMTVLKASSSELTATPVPAPSTGEEPTVFETAASPPPKLEPETKAEPPAPAIAPRRRAEEEAPPHTGRNVALVLLVLVVAAGAYFASSYFNGRQEPGTTASSQKQETPPAEPAPTAETAVPDVEPGKAAAIESPPPPPPAPAPAPVETAQAPPSTRPAAAPKPSIPAAPATVDFRSTPSGARVSFKDSPVESCLTPCSVDLPPGRYVVDVNLAGYRPAVRIFIVPQDTEFNFALEQLSGTLMVRSSPAGAQILVNGQLRQETTPAIIKLPAGKYNLVLRRPGAPDYAEDIEIKDQVISTINVTW